MAQDPNLAPPTTIPPRAQPKRFLRHMTEDELRIVDQLVNFPRDARALKDKGELERRNICRRLAQAIRDGVLQVQHINTIEQDRQFILYAEQQLQDANTAIAALCADGPIVLSDEQLKAVDPNARLFLTRQPDKKQVTIELRKEETPAGQMVKTTNQGVQAAGGPPQAGGEPAASSGTSSQSVPSATGSNETGPTAPTQVPPQPEPPQA